MDLSELQVAMARALRHGRSLALDPSWRAFAEAHFSGSARLSPVEQLEIYREQFWLRHTSSLVEDFPGLCGILGQADWERLSEEYLRTIAPESYTLRNLGLRLPEVVERADWLPHRALCLDMVRLELAYIEVFDAEDSVPLAAERLAGISEEALGSAHLVIAPATRLLSLDYRVADLRRLLRAEGDEPVAIPGTSPHHLVVYRRDRRLWDMPLSDTAFALLSALAAGATLGVAAERAASSPAAEQELAENIGAWLGEWTTKGLICDVTLQAAPSDA